MDAVRRKFGDKGSSSGSSRKIDNYGDERRERRDLVRVTLARRDGTATLVIEDNGRGYDPDVEKAAGTSKGMGVTNMRERARLLGGDVEFQTASGAGTTIYFRVPTKSQ